MKRSRISPISSSSLDEEYTESDSTLEDVVVVVAAAPALFGKPLASVPKPVAITVTINSSSRDSLNVTPKMMFASTSAALETIVEASVTS